MKILFSPIHYIFDEYLFGSELYSSFHIGNRIASKNRGSVLITGKKIIKSKKQYRIIEVQPNEAEFFMSTFRAIFFSLRYTFATIKILRKENFDIIHHVRPFLIGSTFNLVLLLGLNKQIPFVIGSFSSAYKNQGAGVRVPFFEKILALFIQPIIFFLSKQTLKKADAVIVYDKTTKKQAAEYIDEKKIFIIPPGKDKNLYKINDQKEYGRITDFIFVGNLIPRKGCDFLLEIFLGAVQKMPELRLILVGDGPERKKLEEFVKSHNLEENVIFEGKVENQYIQNFYAKAHVFIITQKESSFDQVYIEALAAGLPVITTLNVASQSIIQGKDIGFVISEDNKNDFIEAITFLAQNHEDLKRMSKNARKEFEKNYDWENVIIPKYLQVYDFVLNKKFS